MAFLLCGTPERGLDKSEGVCYNTRPTQDEYSGVLER